MDIPSLNLIPEHCSCIRIHKNKRSIKRAGIQPCCDSRIKMLITHNNDVIIIQPVAEIRAHRFLDHLWLLAELLRQAAKKYSCLKAFDIFKRSKIILLGCSLNMQGKER